MNEINVNLGTILEALNAKADADLNNAEPSNGFIETASSWHLPDYQQASSAGLNTIFSANGWIKATVCYGFNASCNLDIDNIEIINGRKNAGSQGSDYLLTLWIPVLKGSKITAFNNIKNVAFYPCKTSTTASY